MSSKLPILKAIQKYSNSTETDLQAIVFWKTKIDGDMCHYTVMRFNDKIKNGAMTLRSQTPTKKTLRSHTLNIALHRPYY